MPVEITVPAYQCAECSATFASPEQASACETGHAQDRRLAPLVAARDAAKAVYLSAVADVQEACTHPKATRGERESRKNWGDGYDYFVPCHCPFCDKRWEENA